MRDLAAQLRNEITIINQTLAAFGVDAGTKPAWTTVAGGSFVAYGLRTGATQRISDVQRLLPELSERLSAARRRPTPVRLREMPLALEVAHPSPMPLDWRGAVLRVGAGRMVAGRNYSMTPTRDCVIDLAQRPHVLVAGTTGSGKSTVLRMVLSSLAYNSDPATLRLVLVDRKNEDLVPFARLPHVDLAAWTAADAHKAVLSVAAELERRVQAGVGDWPRLVLVVDELAQLSNDSLDLLSAVLAVGRSKRVHVIAATQHPTVRLIGDKANYAVRLVGQVADAQTAALATGRKGSGAELLPGAGAFLLVDGVQLDRLQAYNLHAEAVGVLVGTVAEKWGEAASTPLLPMTVEPEAPVEDEIGRIARTIEPLWKAGASKNAMCKAALERPYAGSYAAKIDRALSMLEASTTTAQLAVAQGAGRTLAEEASSSRTAPAPILRMGAR
jgi:S-DNA-T family DNA segregation ATPase FtsK/SpoIIIE